MCLVETHCELHGIQGNYADIVSLLLKVPQGGEIEHSKDVRETAFRYKILVTRTITFNCTVL